MKLAVVVGFLLATAPAFAHNPDTSYSKIRVFPDRLEFQLTFDLATIPKVVPLQADGQGRITQQALMDQAPTVQKFLQANVLVKLDGVTADLGEPMSVIWPPDVPAVDLKDQQATLIHFLFRLPVPRMPQQLALVYTFFDTFGERHTHLGSIEQGKHRVEEIVFTQLEPDYTYFSEEDPAAVTRSPWRQFLVLGVKHIFLGYDHILFLLALIVVSQFREILKIVTAFTVAHSITLILAAMEVVRLPTRFIEAAIAATIVYVAVENLLSRRLGHRWLLTFGFGLVHGFGFANVLREMALPREGLVKSLLCFNVGVELGQLGIVAVLLPLSMALGRAGWGVKAKWALSAAVGVMGLAWFVERAFALG